METDQNSHSLPRKFPPSNCGAKVPIPPCGLGDAPHSCSNPMSLVFGGWGNWVEELWFNVALESRTAWMQWCWEHPPLCEQPCPNLPKKQIDKNSGPGTGEILCRWRAGAELLPQSQQQPIFLDRPCQVNKLCETHRFCSLSFGHPGAVSDMLCVRKSDLLGTNLWRFI